jgi:L-alanine-DL-glutamate epimerase-like enolase superfamily enzyme
MIITKIEVLVVDVPFIKPFKIASGITPTERVIVKVHTDENLLGLGESRPNPAFGGETAEDVAVAIKYFERHLLGRNPFEIEKILQLMDTVLPEHHFAKWGLDMALYDLKAKALKVPLYELLGGCYREKMPLGWAVGIGSTQSMVDDAVNGLKKGFKAIKVKIGNDPVTDIRNVKAVRDAIGPDVPLRVDANQGYTPDMAVRALRKMERYDLQLIEQPVPAWDLRGMSKIAKSLDTPIMADESVSKPQDVIRIFETGAASILNIKLAKLGGIRKGKQITAIASALDLPCFGSGMNEIAMGVAASAHFMASTNNVNFEFEFASGIFFVEDTLVKETLKVTDGMLEVPRKPGLGVELDEEKIIKYRKDSTGFS